MGLYLLFARLISLQNVGTSDHCPLLSRATECAPGGVRQSEHTTMMMHSLADVLFHGCVALHCVPSSWM
jgi:hypothetical protein